MSITYSYFLIIFLLNLVFSSVKIFAFLELEEKENDETLDEHLARKLRNAKNEIAKEFVKNDEELEAVVTISYDVKWEKIGNGQLNFSESPTVVKIFDKMFILEGNRTMWVDVKSNSNETQFLNQLQRATFLRKEDSIKFAKSIVWKSRLYLFVCNKADCNLYIGENDSHLEHSQKMRHEGTADAIFFTRDNRLYLVVTHEKMEKYSGSSTIYHWTGSYMDMMKSMETDEGALVTSFNYGRSTIIIFAQPGSPDVLVEIYKFHNNKIERIQYLPIEGKISMIRHVHDRLDFLLIVKEDQASNLYWWDGNEFSHWLDLPDIVGPSKINIARVNDDMLLFASYEDIVVLYKITRTKYSRLNFLNFRESREKVIDMALRIDEKLKIVDLLLVTLDPMDNLYRIESWRLSIKKKRENNSANLRDEVDETEKCLLKLKKKLEDRMEIMENLTVRTWPELHEPEVDMKNGKSLKIDNVILESIDDPDSIKIDKIEIDLPENTNNIFLPPEVKIISEKMKNLAFSIFNDSKNLLRINGDNYISGNVVVRENAKFRNFRTNSFRIHFLNGQKFNLENFFRTFISSTGNQMFPNSQLTAKNITVKNLQIDRLCGIPQEYWLKKDNERSNDIFTGQNLTDVIFENDTIFVKSTENSFTTILPDLKLKSLEKVDMEDFFNNLFIVGEKQQIKGNIFHRNSENSKITVTNLETEKLNGISKENLITRSNNQNFTNDLFFNGKFFVKDLKVRKINGIPIENFAMVSKKNHVTGQLSIAKIKILNKLTIDDTKIFFNDRPTQIYENVTIFGNVETKKISMKSATNFSLGSIKRIIEDNWTKKTNQIIERSILFDRGLTIDKLNTDFLNDLNLKNDLIFTNVSEICPKNFSIRFENLTIGKIVLKDRLNNSEKIEKKLYEDSNDSLIINEEIRLEQLSVTKLFIQNYNQVPVDVIMEKKNFQNSSIFSYEYPETDSMEKFENLIVKDRLETKDLYLNFVTETNGSLKKEDRKRIDVKYLRLDENLTIDRLKSEILTVGNLSTDGTEGTRTKNILDWKNNCFSQNLEKKGFFNSTENYCKFLTIDGDLEIENDLRVSRIDEKSVDSYFEGHMTENMTVSSPETITIEDLKITENLTSKFPSQNRLEILRDRVLSKSKNQNFQNSGISFYEINVDDLEARRINDRETKQIIYTDDELIFFPGKVIFQNLNISTSEPETFPRIRSRFINGHMTENNELYEKLGNISARLIGNLTVIGNMTWPKKNDDENDSLLEKIMRGALLRDEKTIIIVGGNENKSTTIESSGGIFVAAMKYYQPEMTGNKKEINVVDGIDVRKIVEDSVLDDSTGNDEPEVQVEGEKKFLKNLKCENLEASGNVDVKFLEKWPIARLKKTVVSLNFSKDENTLFPVNKTTVIFRRNVRAGKMIIPEMNNNENFIIHDRPISGIFFIDRNDEIALPEMTEFKELVVVNNASVKTLDSIDLDRFDNDRVKINSPPEVHVVIHGNVQFNGLVRVSENATVRSINNYATSDFVLNDFHDDQIIDGKETSVSGSLTIHGKVYAPLVAGINLTDAYESAVLNNEAADIFGNVIFQAEIEKTSGDVNFSRKELCSDADNPKNPIGFVNGFPLNNLTNNQNKADEIFFQNLGKNENKLEKKINRLANIHLPEIFHYFEEEKNFSITNVASVERVRVNKMADTTILSFYTKESPIACGLENKENCQCRGQYIAEINASGDDCRSWKLPDSKIFYHFHEKNGAFGVNVVTNTVSRSKDCNLFTGSYENDTKALMEFTTISWMKNELFFFHRNPFFDENFSTSNVTGNDLKIYGYLSDAFVFTINNFVFIILAIFYDPVRSTHQTDSFIYELDLSKNSLKLFQKIATSYAYGIHVFDIPGKGPHIFVSSFADGDPTESLLYRLEKNTEFRLLKKFPNGGNRHAKSVSRSKEEFLFVDDFSTNSINVYRYDSENDDFSINQNIHYDSPVSSIETFYTGEFRYSQVYVIVTTERDQFFIYEYDYTNNFQLIGEKRVSGILSMVPFEVGNRRYIFLGSDKNSTILRIVEQGLNHD